MSNPYSNSTATGMGIAGLGAAQTIYGSPLTATTTSTYNPFTAPPPPSWPYDYFNSNAMIGIFRVRKVENGYIVDYQLRSNDMIREYYAETLKDVGERIAALGVEKALKGETTGP